MIFHWKSMGGHNVVQHSELRDARGFAGKGGDVQQLNIRHPVQMEDRAVCIADLRKLQPDGALGSQPIR